MGVVGFILGFWFRFPAFGLDLGGVWVGFGWRLGGVWVGVGWLDLGPVVVIFSDGLGDLFHGFDGGFRRWVFAGFDGGSDFAMFAGFRCLLGLFGDFFSVVTDGLRKRWVWLNWVCV